MSSFEVRAICEACPHRMVCRCLKVTEQQLVEALITLEIRSIRDLRDKTGAGDGCTACHCRLQGYLDLYAPSSPSMCSVR
jgi:bacterioferritin-associated ferredoxin